MNVSVSLDLMSVVISKIYAGTIMCFFKINIVVLITSIGMSVSPKIFHQVYEESQGLTPNELWTTLKVLFGNKEYCEYFMQEVE
jgi:hypothetical protein